MPDYCAACGLVAVGRCTHCHQTFCSSDASLVDYAHDGERFYEIARPFGPGRTWWLRGEIPEPGPTVGHWKAFEDGWNRDPTFVCRACRQIDAESAVARFVPPPEPPTYAGEPIDRLIEVARRLGTYPSYSFEALIEEIGHDEFAIEVARALRRLEVPVGTVVFRRDLPRKSSGARLPRAQRSRFLDDRKAAGWHLRSYHSHNSETGHSDHEAWLLVDGRVVCGEIGRVVDGLEGPARRTSGVLAKPSAVPWTAFLNPRAVGEIVNVHFGIPD